MPIDLSWYEPQRIVRAHVYGEAGLSELKQMIVDIQPYLEEGIAPVHVILDDATAGPPPISIKQLKDIMDTGKRSIDKLGWIVGIGDVNPIAKMVIPLLAKIVKIKHVRVDTLDAALTVLKKQDLSLTIGETEN